MTTTIKADLIDFLVALEDASLAPAIERLKQSDIAIPQDESNLGQGKEGICLFSLLLFTTKPELMTDRNKDQFDTFAEKVQLGDALGSLIVALKEENYPNKALLRKLVNMFTLPEPAEPEPSNDDKPLKQK